MLKKIILSTLLVGLISILVVGAIYRTQAKASNETGLNQTGEGRATQREVQGYGTGNTNQGLGDTNAVARGNGQGRNSGNSSENSAYPLNESRGEGQAQISEQVAITGNVTSVDNILLVISTASGDTVEVANRAWSFAQEQGFSTQVGDSLSLTGFYDTDDTLEVSKIENVNTGELVLLRDENGRPMWAGRGRRGS